MRHDQPLRLPQCRKGRLIPGSIVALADCSGGWRAATGASRPVPASRRSAYSKRASTPASGPYPGRARERASRSTRNSTRHAPISRVGGLFPQLNPLCRRRACGVRLPPGKQAIHTVSSACIAAPSQDSGDLHLPASVPISGWEGDLYKSRPGRNRRFWWAGRPPDRPPCSPP